MRRELEQPPALAARLEDEVQIAVLQVAHAAVDEARRAARSPRREVLALDQRDREAPPGGVPRDARARDPAADDQEVEPAVAEFGDALGAAWDGGSAHGDRLPPGPLAREEAAYRRGAAYL